MLLKYGVLGLVNLTPMTGYELDKTFKNSLNYIWKATSSQIYSELDSMEKQGWLTSERVVQDERPNKRVYSITEKGKTELMDWMLKPEADLKNSLTGKNAFLFRVLLAGNLTKEQSLKLLYDFRKVCIIRKAAQDDIYEEIGQDANSNLYDKANLMFFNIAALHGDIMMEAKIEWVEKAIKIVENADYL